LDGKSDGKKPFKCGECSKRFGNQGALAKHKKDKHKPPTKDTDQTEMKVDLLSAPQQQVCALVVQYTTLQLPLDHDRSAKRQIRCATQYTS